MSFHRATSLLRETRVKVADSRSSEIPDKLCPMESRADENIIIYRNIYLIDVKLM
jgi:hypothetical protein